MRGLGNGFVGLCTVKAIEGGKPYRHAFVTDRYTDHHVVALKEVSYVFPLWQRPQDLADAARPNVAAGLSDRLAALCGLAFEDGTERGNLTTTFGARDVFDWIYAALHSPAYRERYADFLKSAFARVPLPRDRALLAALIPLGTKLVALHLLDPVAAPILADPAVRLVNPTGVPARLDGRKADARRNAAGRVYVNDACWFETVPASVWDHWIGGYQPAQKWLKDRAEKGGKNKREGRVLTPEDQLHYRRMIVALEETAKIMGEIDKVIAKHGGWPDAFRGMTD